VVAKELLQVLGLKNVTNTLGRVEEDCRDVLCVSDPAGRSNTRVLVLCVVSRR
jgi:hypothetical protein